MRGSDGSVYKESSYDELHREWENCEYEEESPTDLCVEVRDNKVVAVYTSTP